MLSKGSFIENNFFKAVQNVKIDLSEYQLGNIIGLGAIILNGYSNEYIIGNLTYLTNIKDLDGLSTGIFKLIYIKDYKEPDFGFNNHVSTPERTVCDFLMYPNELCADLWIYDILEGYLEDEDTPNDWGKVYEMMEHFGIDRCLLEDRLSKLEKMQEV